jgi:ferredoxin
MLARFFKRAEASHRVSVSGLGIDLEVPRESTILEWALGQGISFPHSCRVGTCGTCKCRLVSGKVYELSDRSYALSGEALAANLMGIAIGSRPSAIGKDLREVSCRRPKADGRKPTADSRTHTEGSWTTCATISAF